MPILDLIAATRKETTRRRLPLTGAAALAAALCALALAAQSSAVGSPPETKRVAVVLINFRDDDSQPFTVAQARRVIFSGPDSAAAYYREVSDGALRLTGRVFDWITLDASGNLCGAGSKHAEGVDWDAAARARLAEAGVDLEAFDFVLYGMPTVDACDAAGRAWTTCSDGRCLRRAFVFAPEYVLGRSVAIHELGHLLGAGHAGRYTCELPDGTVAPISASCTTGEYDDPYVVMGSRSAGEFDAYRRASLGWLAPQEVQTVVASGVYTLSPIERPGGVRALQVPRERNADGRVTSYYWLEFRRPLGFDAYLGSLQDVTLDGVQIRVAPGADDRGAHTGLIDTTPETYSDLDQALAPGHVFYDAAGSVAIANLGVSGDTVRVRVRLTLPDDTTPPPAPARVWDGAGARDAEVFDTESQNELYLSWSPVRDVAGGSGLAGYEYCVATRVSPQGCAGTIVGAWSTAWGTRADFITGSIPFWTGKRYYGCVRARDNAGNVSEPRCSDGQVR